MKNEKLGSPDVEESGPLFREEAVRDHVEGRIHGELLRISPAWTRWVEPLLAATIVGAAAFAGLVEVNQFVSGPALVLRASGPAGGPDLDSTRAEALEVIACIPGRDRNLLSDSLDLHLRFPDSGGAPFVLPIASIAQEVVAPERARELLGEDAAGLLSFEGPVVLVRAALTREAGESTRGLVPGVVGRADICVGRRRLIREILPEGAP